MIRLERVKPRNPRRKYWYCKDCKFHKSNITKEELMKLNIPNVEEPCDTNPNEIICYVSDFVSGFCFEPLESKVTVSLTCQKDG